MLSNPGSIVGLKPKGCSDASSIAKVIVSRSDEFSHAREDGNQKEEERTKIKIDGDTRVEIVESIPLIYDVNPGW